VIYVLAVWTLFSCQLAIAKIYVAVYKLVLVCSAGKTSYMVVIIQYFPLMYGFFEIEVTAICVAKILCLAKPSCMVQGSGLFPIAIHSTCETTTSYSWLWQFLPDRQQKVIFVE